MTLLGKFFSAAIALLSFGFMMLALVANASHRNWRDVVLAPGGLKEQIETIERTNDQLRDSRQRTEAALAREQAARRTALAALQTQLDQLSAQLRDSEAAVRQLQAENTELSQMARSDAEELQILTAQTRRLREQISQEQADRDKLFAQTLVLTDDMNTLRGTVQSLGTRNEQLLAEVTRYKEVVDAHGLNIDDPLHGAPPERNGKVLVVNRPAELVEVSIGYDDGLRQGHELEVTRGGRYVTKLRVRNTEPDRAVAEIMRDYSAGIVQEGDRVDTTIE